MINRRKIVEVGLLTAAASLVPSWAALAPPPQRRADLIVTSFSWSNDGGTTFHTGHVNDGDDVLFRAVVKNQGQVMWPSGIVLGVLFMINGVGRAWSDTHVSGLAKGASVTLTANSGPDGDRYWNDVAEGSYTAVAWADDPNRLQESNENNNTRTATIVVDAPMGGTPIANDDTASTPVNTAVTILVLANDGSDPPGQPLRVSAVQSPTVQGGTAIIAGGGQSIIYTPPTNFQGQDSFTYEVEIAA